jgi:hypothetical protein
VHELLEQPPNELEVARYADKAWWALKATAHSDAQGDDADVPRHPPVSFYLPAPLAEPYEALRESAYRRVKKIHQDLKAEARRRYPVPTQVEERAVFIATELTRLDVPARLPTITAGAIARMAIDRWRRRAVDKVAQAAVAYAAEVHDQPHRARRDMQKLRR